MLVTVEKQKPSEGRSSFYPVEEYTMPKCPTCNKEVYFAEKVSSIGKDWHRGCLKCAKCSKTLAAGSHAEREGKPYCHNPCYSAMFGPKGYGHGGTESHTFDK